MSTRCNVLIKDENESRIFYHHCDGYPDGVGADLRHFIGMQLKRGEHSASEAADMILNGCIVDHYDGSADMSYEEVDQVNGDIEWLYVIDLKDRSFETYKVNAFSGENEVSTIEDF